MMAETDIATAIRDAISNTSITEWLIFLTALLYVILAALENSWCWLFGIIASLLSVYLCFTGLLYLESALQIFYVFMGIYGWWNWKRKNAQQQHKPISVSARKDVAIHLSAGLLIMIPLGYIAENYSRQALPWLDAFITAFSLVATYLTTQKKLENWIYWIIIDSAAVLLYASRDFYLLAVLYIIYSVLSVAGLFAWRKKIK